MVIQSIQSSRCVYICQDLNYEPFPQLSTVDDKNNHALGEEGRDGVHAKQCARGHWRPQEDAKLKELVAHYGPQNWNLIAEKLQGRSGKSCRLRWFNQLDPKINRKSFCEEEEERLVAAHKIYGNKWAMIAKLFPDRTDNSVKNHLHVIMARFQRKRNSVYCRRRNASSSNDILLPTQNITATIVRANDQENCSGLINNHMSDAWNDPTNISTNKVMMITAACSIGTTNVSTSTMNCNSTSVYNIKGDESAASTCTHISLNHEYPTRLSAAEAENILSEFDPLCRAHYQPFLWSHMDLKSTLSAAANKKVVMGGLNSDDSNSDVASISTTTDSVANYTIKSTMMMLQQDNILGYNNNNVKLYEDEINEKKGIHFIDFLGVGSTAAS